MLDPEYVERIDLEMEQSGGELAPDDHEAVWENLKASDEWAAQLEFAIALLTAAPLAEVLEMTRDEAATRHPMLPREEALKAEVRLRDRFERAVRARAFMDEVARMRRNLVTSAEMFGDEAISNSPSVAAERSQSQRVSGATVCRPRED